MSAKNPKDIEKLIEVLKVEILKSFNKQTLYIPYDENIILNELFTNNYIEIIEEDEFGYTLSTYIQNNEIKTYKPFIKVV